MSAKKKKPKVKKADPGKDLLKGVLKGEVRAIARMISLAEAAKPESRDILAEVYRHAGGAHVVGLTGVPGSGRSTLACGLAMAIRQPGPRGGTFAMHPPTPC